MATEFLGRVVKKDGKIGIVPDTMLDREQLEMVHTDGVVKVTVVVPRNPKFHRKGFALITTVFEFMDEKVKEDLGIFTIEMLRKRLLLDLGRFTITVMGPGNGAIPEGSIIYEADSMSFAKMDDTEFETLYNQIIMISIEKYVSGQTEESINRRVDEIIRFGERG
jgi:hypothetical protein